MSIQIQWLRHGFPWGPAGFSSSLPGKHFKGFPSRPIGIPDDVRRAPDDVIWIEIWGDGKNDSSDPSVWDDGNVANGDGYRKRQGYSSTK